MKKEIIRELFVEHFAEVGKMVVLKPLMGAIDEHFVDINKMVGEVVVTKDKR